MAAGGDYSLSLAEPVQTATERFGSRAAEFGRWEDDLWDTYVLPHGPSQHHEFSGTEMHNRLALFGAYMCVWMVALGILSILALAKREHGSIREAIKAWRSMKRRELVQIVVQGKRYDQLDPDIDSDEDEKPEGRKKGSCCRCCCCSKVKVEEEDEEPPKFMQGPMKVREEDKVKMASLKKKIQEREAAGRPEEVEKELQELKGISKLREGDKEKAKATFEESAQSPMAAERDRLLILQVEELQGENTAVPCIQRIKVVVTVLLFVGYVVICAGIPFFAADQASCKQGLPWEYHMPFFHYFLLVKLWEVYLIAFDTSIPGRTGLKTFVIKFGCSFLAFFDGYSDSNAILIAHVCGSDLWHWMAVCYVVGVVVLQWVFLGTLTLVLDTSNTCLFKMLHMDSLAECSAMKPNEKHALTAWRMVNIFRFTFEDLPQSVIQIIFIVTVNRNYIMICSVCVGVCTSAKAIYDAFKRAAAAVGTNFEYLRAVSDMQAAMERENAKDFFEAYEIAESSGANKDSLQERLAQAEEKFGFLSAQKTPYRMMIGMPDRPVSEAVERTIQNASAEDTYSTRRRTVDWAVREANSRSKELKAREHPKSAIVEAGCHHEGRHSWRTFISKRRTVDFALKVAQEREKLLHENVREGPVVGNRPKNVGEANAGRDDKGQPPLKVYESQRRTVDLAIKAQQEREKLVHENVREGPVVGNRPKNVGEANAGHDDEGQPPLKAYESQRRTVDFAIKAQQEREKRLQELVREGPAGSCCLGSRPKNAGEVADETCSLGVGR